MDTGGCSTDLQDQERQPVALNQAGKEIIRGDKITGISNYRQVTSNE